MGAATSASGRRAPAHRGDTLADRVIDVLRRATQAMEAEPAAVRGGHHRARLDRPARRPVPARDRRDHGPHPWRWRSRDDFDRATRDDIVRTLGHVWFSSLVGWVNGWYGIGQAGDELEVAAHLLLDQYD